MVPVHSAVLQLVAKLFNVTNDELTQPNQQILTNKEREKRHSIPGAIGESIHCSIGAHPGTGLDADVTRIVDVLEDLVRNGAEQVARPGPFRPNSVSLQPC